MMFNAVTLLILGWSIGVQSINDSPKPMALGVSITDLIMQGPRKSASDIDCFIKFANEQNNTVLNFMNAHNRCEEQKSEMIDKLNQKADEEFYKVLLDSDGICRNFDSCRSNIDPFDSLKCFGIAAHPGYLELWNISRDAGNASANIWEAMRRVDVKATECKRLCEYEYTVNSIDLLSALHVCLNASSTTEPGENTSTTTEGISSQTPPSEEPSTAGSEEPSTGSSEAPSTSNSEVPSTASSEASSISSSETPSTPGSEASSPSEATPTTTEEVNQFYKMIRMLR